MLRVTVTERVSSYIKDWIQIFTVFPLAYDFVTSLSLGFHICQKVVMKLISEILPIFKMLLFFFSTLIYLHHFLSLLIWPLWLYFWFVVIASPSLGLFLLVSPSSSVVLNMILLCHFCPRRQAFSFACRINSAHVDSSSKSFTIYLVYNVIHAVLKYLRDVQRNLSVFLRVNWIIRGKGFCPFCWLISVSIILSGSIHVVENGRISSFLWLSSISLYLCTKSLFRHPLNDT